MLNHYLVDLASSIQWAQCQDDMDVLRMAKARLNDAISYVAGMDCDQQKQAAFAQIDQLLPMEWPMWMEACRFGDAATADATLLH
jgi:hypothetical protein